MNIKKYIIAFALLAVVAVPASTHAQSQVEELTMQISSLLSIISDLQARLIQATGRTTGSTSVNLLSDDSNDTDERKITEFLVDDSVSSASCVKLSNNLRKGDTDDSKNGQVSKLQRFLFDQNLLEDSEATGYFGTATRKAVGEWQCKNGIVCRGDETSTGYGRVGKQTRAAMASSCDQEIVLEEGRVVTIASTAQPANSLALSGATHVPFTKFTLTNNSRATQTIDSVLVQRNGHIEDAAFASVVLLDQHGIQIGRSKTLNSEHKVAIGEPITFGAGESRTFTVAANMNSDLTNYAGQLGSLSVVAVNTSSVVKGDLPITGATHIASGISVVEIFGTDGAPVIQKVSGPTTLSVGETGTWTIDAYDQSNQGLSYYMDWGERVAYAAAPAVSQSTMFEHSYSSAGVYTVTATVANNSGQSTRAAITVTVQAKEVASKQNFKVFSRYGEFSITRLIGAERAQAFCNAYSIVVPDATCWWGAEKFEGGLKDGSPMISIIHPEGNESWNASDRRKEIVIADPEPNNKYFAYFRKYSEKTSEIEWVQEKTVVFEKSNQDNYLHGRVGISDMEPGKYYLVLINKKTGLVGATGSYIYIASEGKSYSPTSMQMASVLDAIRTLFGF